VVRLGRRWALVNQQSRPLSTLERGKLEPRRRSLSRPRGQVQWGSSRVRQRRLGGRVF
jgi:hypothetical protein